MKLLQKNHKFWLFYNLVSSITLYLFLTWKTTENIDLLTTNSLFCVAIVWLLWQKKDCLNYSNDPIASFLGFGLISFTLVKALSLIWFEAELLLPLVPFFLVLGLALIASGFKNIYQYGRELLLALVLFFPDAVFGFFLERFVNISILTAKFSTYFLYYLGFNVTSRGDEVLLSLPKAGIFKAVVYPFCTGSPIICLTLKLSLLLIAFFSFRQNQKTSIFIFSISLGFLLGVIRVSILTLTIPNPARFEYWHGTEGSQIFSTLAIAIFFGFCYWMIQRQSKQTNIADAAYAKAVSWEHK